MDASEFLRLFPLRAPNLMWFLGAGASAAAGIPTAYSLIWDFKRSLFCTSQRKPIAHFADLADDKVRKHIQSYFDAQPNFPAMDAPGEYSFFFQAALPDEADRRQYLDRLVRTARPSFGHRALAELCRAGLARLIWTTNFDRTIEDARVEAYGTSSELVTVTTENAGTASEALAEERWPMLVKLHGDFQSRQLKNTPEELRTQHERLVDCFCHAARTRGMLVVGYSGRDESVLAAMHRAIDKGRGFPSGLFWFRRSGSPLLENVSTLLAKAQSAGIQAEEVIVETFDEMLADLLGALPSPCQNVNDLLRSSARRASDAPTPPTRGGWPVVRMNAVPFIQVPALCRKVVCEIGGYAAVREAIQSANADVIAARRNTGVLAFGDDSEIRRTFNPFHIAEYSLHGIEPHRLAWESAELGLLYDALRKALERSRGVRAIRRGRGLYVVPSQGDDEIRGAAKLRSVVGTVSGTVPGTQIPWYEAAGLRIASSTGRLWLVIEPTVVVDYHADKVPPADTKEFVRERLARRYNQIANKLLDAWLDILVGEEAEATLSAFGRGIDATFIVARTTGFSWRGGAR